MKSVKILLLIFTVLQASPPPVPVRGDRFQIAVPQGWKVLNSGDDIIRQLGQPRSSPGEAGKSRTFFYNIGPATVRYDVDGSDKIVTVFVIRNR